MGPRVGWGEGLSGGTFAYPVGEHRPACRRKWSSSFPARRPARGSLRPIGCQSRGNQRQKNFVVHRDGVPSRFGAARARRGGGGALDYVLQRPVMLDEIEIGGRDRPQGN